MCYLANLEAKHLLKVRRLADEKQIESPASAEIGHNDGINWHGCKEGPPRRVEFLQEKRPTVINPSQPVIDYYWSLYKSGFAAVLMPWFQLLLKCYCMCFFLCVSVIRTPMVCGHQYWQEGASRSRFIP